MKVNTEVSHPASPSIRVSVSPLPSLLAFASWNGDQSAGVFARIRTSLGKIVRVCVGIWFTCAYVERPQSGAEHAEPRSVVSTRLERLNRSTSLLLYTLCALPPRTRAPNERTPTLPRATPSSAHPLSLCLVLFLVWLSPPCFRLPFSLSISLATPNHRPT